MLDEWQLALRDLSSLLETVCLVSRVMNVEISTYARVTQATSGAKPSMWSFSRASTFSETNMGKYAFWTSISLIFALNHSGHLSVECRTGGKRLLTLDGLPYRK